MILTVENMDVVEDSLTLPYQTRTLALERAADEAGNLDGVSVCEILVEENALRGAEDGRRDDQDGLDVAYAVERLCQLSIVLGQTTGGRTLLIGFEEEHVHRTVECLRADLLELVDLEIRVDALVDVVAELVVPVDENAGTRLSDRRIISTFFWSGFVICSPCGT